MKNKFYLIGLIIFYIAIVFGICLFKYANNFYNGIDLGIFTQAFHNLSQGSFLDVPLQGHQYWADHFSLMFFVFYPLYYLWQSPLLLLFLQTVFIGLAAWPLYLISKKYLSDRKSFLIVALFLFNPFVISMNLFEFHFLPIIFFFFFFLFYFYLRKNWPGFYIFLFLCLAIREDISIFLLGFAAFMLYERVKESNWKSALWRPEIIITFIVSIIWFIGSWFIIKHFNQEPSKFLVYFDWIKDWKTVIFHFISLKQLEFLLMIFLPFAFLPLFKPKYLLIGLFYYLELAFSFGAPIVNLHYGAPLLAVGLLSLIFVLKDFQIKKFKNFSLEMYKKISIILLIVTTIYLNTIFGPWIDLNKKNPNRDLENYLIEQIDQCSNMVAPSKFYNKLIEKSKVYSLERVFWGNEQFSEQKYEIPAQDCLLIDQDEILSFNFEKDAKRFGESYDTGIKRIQDLISQNSLELVENTGKYLLYSKKQLSAGKELDQKYKLVKIRDFFPEYDGQILMIDQNKFIQPFVEEIYLPFDNEQQIRLQLVEVKGHLDLDNLMYAYNKITNLKAVSEEVLID